MLHEAQTPDEFKIQMEAALELALELDPELKYDESMWYDDDRDDLLAEINAYRFDLVEDAIAHAEQVHADWLARKTPREGFITAGHNGKIQLRRGGRRGRSRKEKRQRKRLTHSEYLRRFSDYITVGDWCDDAPIVLEQPATVEDKPTEIDCGRGVLVSIVYDDKGQIARVSGKRHKDLFVYDWSAPFTAPPKPLSKKQRRKLRAKRVALKNEKREQQKRCNSYSAEQRRSRQQAATILHQLERDTFRSLRKDRILQLQKEYFAGRTPKCNRKKVRKIKNQCP